jgi:hypothetical protein
MGPRIRRAIEDFKGNSSELESAIGMYFLGYAFGWRYVYMVHSVATVRKYERILDIIAKDVFPERTPHSERSVAFQVLDQVSNFWKAVKGEKRPEGFTNPEIT